MKTQRKTAGTVIDTLETRTLMSGSPFGFNFHNHAPPSPTLAADQAQLQTDVAQFRTDAQSLASTLQTDRKLLQTAVTAARTGSASSAITTLKNDQTTEQGLIQTALAAVAAARGTTGLTAAVQALQAVEKSAQTLLQGDAAAVQNAIKADPAVVAAQAKLTLDSQPLTIDLALIQADQAKIAADLGRTSGGGDFGEHGFGGGGFESGDGGGLELGGLGFGDGYGRIPWSALNSTNPAVQADVAQIKADQTQLQTDIAAALPKLQADRSALYTAIKAVEAGSVYTTDLAAVQTARTALQTAVSADLTQILADRGNTAAELTDISKLQSDQTAGRTAIQAAETTLNSLVTSDSGVSAAKTQIATDSQNIVNDQALLQADFAQLRKDLGSV